MHHSSLVIDFTCKKCSPWKAAGAASRMATLRAASSQSQRLPALSASATCISASPQRASSPSPSSADASLLPSACIILIDIVVLLHPTLYDSKEKL